jgi:NADH:ubiquinone oxidoreductase subunit 6 (subunit J)
MNWAGMGLGVSLALALIGGAGAAFARHPRAAVAGLAVAMLGVAGACFALGNEYLAIVVAALLGAGVPTILMLALAAAPPVESDRRPGRRAVLWLALMAAGAGVLALVLLRARWVPAGSVSQNTVEWLGSRFLTDHLVTLDLIAALLCVAACGAVALLRGRTARRP